MRITAHAAKAAEFSEDARLLDDGAIVALNTCEFTKEQVERLIDNLNVSADAKSRLHSISGKSIEVMTVAGKVVIWIGRKILDIVAFLVREFPNATFGVILGLVVGYLIGLIPIIGFLFGPFIGKILAAFGLIQGGAQDLREKDVRRRVLETCRQDLREGDIERRLVEICRQFDALKTESA